MRNLYAFCLVVFMSLTAFSQTAPVQIIHNSPDALAAEVDIYLDGALVLDDVAFRTATPFLDLPADTPIEIAVAPGNSTSVADAVGTFPVTLNSANTYVVVATGLLDMMSYSPFEPFNLEIYDMGRETATSATNTDVLVYHGATDAPTVDVVEVGVPAGILVDDISYTEFQGYLELPTDNYALQVTNADGSVIVAAYEAPLADLNLDGEAIVALASGFLDPSMNNNGPSFGIWVALAAGGPLVELPTSTARAQIIHNSADELAEVVDVYVNGSLALDDLAFRTATPFIDLPASVEIEVAVAPGNSTSVADAISTTPFTLARNETYIVVADGIVSGTGYDPVQPFSLEVYAMGRETATSATNTDILVHHGATDAPTVDIVEVGVPAGILVDDISYSEFQGYLELPTDNYALQVTNADGSVIVAAYEAPLADLNLIGEAVVAIASGFLDPSMNSDGPAFGIWVALAAGGPLVELPISTARTQIIHNSADALAEVVDIYVNDALAIDDFTFRTATPFIDLPATVEFDVSVAPGNSTSVGDAIATVPFTLERNSTYIVVADGIVSPTGYNPAPPLSLEVYDMGREVANNNTLVDVLVHHGATDAPTVDINEVEIINSTLVDDISYSEYRGYLSFTPRDYVLEVTDETGTTSVGLYAAPLETLGLQGEALVVLASGFLDPSQNSNGAPFGLWVALSSGGDLVELTAPALGITDVEAQGITMYPNPAIDSLIIDSLVNQDLNIQIVDITGRIVLSDNINGSKQAIDVSNLAQGIYQVIFNNGSKTIGSKKLIKR